MITPSGPSLLLIQQPPERIDKKIPMQIDITNPDLLSPATCIQTQLYLFATHHFYVKWCDHFYVDTYQD